MAQLAANRLSEFAQSGAPFFLAVGFFRPHTPFLAPEKYFEFHSIKDIVVPDREEKAWQKLPLPAQRSLRAKTSQLEVQMDTAKAIIQAYRASVSFVDAQVGRVLEALKDNGLEDNTLVVFVSDHGYHLGEHGHWQKQTLFEKATRVPLIVKGGSDGAAGFSDDRPVELVDLYPTVASWAGIAFDETLPGTDLFASDEASKIPRHGSYTEWRKGASLRTKNHRITRWGEKGDLGWELYDHSSDPLEISNLADDASMSQTFDSLRLILMQVDSLHKQVPSAAGPVNGSAKPLPRTPPVLGQPHSPEP